MVQLKMLILLVSTVLILAACKVDFEGASCDGSGCETYSEVVYCDDRFCGNVVKNGYRHLVIEYEGFIYETDGQELIVKHDIYYNDQLCEQGNQVMLEHYFDRNDNYIVALTLDGNLYYSNNNMARYPVMSPYKYEEEISFCGAAIELYEQNKIMQEVNIRNRPWFIDQDLRLVTPLDIKQITN